MHDEIKNRLTRSFDYDEGDNLNSIEGEEPINDCSPAFYYGFEIPFAPQQPFRGFNLPESQEDVNRALLYTAIINEYLTEDICSAYFMNNKILVYAIDSVCLENPDGFSYDTIMKWSNKLEEIIDFLDLKDAKIRWIYSSLYCGELGGKLPTDEEIKNRYNELVILKKLRDPK